MNAEKENIVEIIDIEFDIIKTKKLLNEHKYEELNKHIDNIIKKYPFEATVYNLINPIKPKTFQENASNCIQFLSILLIKKSIENLEK